MRDTSPSPLLVTLVTLLAFLLMLLLSAAAVYLVTSWADINLFQPGPGGPAERNAVRLAMLLNNFLLFTGTAALALFTCYRRGAAAAVSLTALPHRRDLSYASLLFVIALPLIGFSAYFNLQLDLPDWALRGEDQSTIIIEQILTMPDPGEFLLALVTVAVIPGFGEELLFRGLVQQRILGGLTGKHAAVWITAVLFSAVHLEFAGFLPRLLLGALLGYALFFTRSLWGPIILHILFNGIQVVMAYVSGEFTPDTELPDLPHWSVGLLSLLLTIALFVHLLRQRAAATPNSGTPPSPGTRS